MKRMVRYVTLVLEHLAVIGIILALAGIAYASTGRLREQARQAVCISNLRKIGRALAMYRQDYGGDDESGVPSQMALPPRFLVLNTATRSQGGPYLASNDDVFHCPDAPVRTSGSARRWSDYFYQKWPNVKLNGMPPFPVALARRGLNFPIVLDMSHDLPRFTSPASQRTHLVILLRLDGRVSVRHVPRASNSWTW